MYQGKLKLVVMKMKMIIYIFLALMDHQVEHALLWRRFRTKLANKRKLSHNSGKCSQIKLHIYNQNRHRKKKKIKDWYIIVYDW